MATPIEIEIALHYYYHVGDFREGDFSAPAVRDTLFKFEQFGLLDRTEHPGADRRYGRTEALEIYVNALCSVGYPVKTWVMPEAKPQVTPGMRRAIDALRPDLRKEWGI